MSESKDHWQNQVASGAFGFDVRIEDSQQLGSERQIRSTSLRAIKPVANFTMAAQVICAGTAFDNFIDGLGPRANAS